MKDNNPQISVSSDRKRATIKLLFPFEYNGEKVKQLVMRRPKLRDSILAEKQAGKDNDTEMMIIRLANLCEVEPDLIEEMDEIEDFENLQEAYALFRPKKPDNKK